MTYNEINIFDVIEGKDAAWRDVYTCFWRKLVYYCLNKKLESIQLDAEESVQLAMLKVYQYRHKLKSTKHLSNLLYLAVVQASSQRHRAEGVFKKYDKYFASFFDEYVDPREDEIDLDKVLVEVIEYIATLKPKYMELFRQKYSEMGKKVPAHSNKFYLDSSRLKAKINRKFNIT